MSERRRRVGFFNVSLVVICAALAVLVVLLSLENKRLKDRLAADMNPIPETAMKAGDTLDALVVIDEAGTPSTVRFDQGDQDTLLLVFSIQCPACAKNMPIWNNLLENARNSPVRVLGIQTDRKSEPSELVQPAFPFEICELDPTESAFLTKIPYVPATLLVDRHGAVQEAWYGVLDATKQNALTRFLISGRSAALTPEAIRPHFARAG